MIFALLYLSPTALSLDQLVQPSSLTKGAISTNVRALARIGLVHLPTKLRNRKDYYKAETGFYTSIRNIPDERQNKEFARAIQSASETLTKLRASKGLFNKTERKYLFERLQALQGFFAAIDNHTRAERKSYSLRSLTVWNFLSILN